jgi:uncharacterized protein YqjF (DUF2071 family)
VRLSLTACDLVVLSWAVSPGAVRRELPPALEPALDPDGRAVVSLAAFRNTEVRVSGRQVPGFCQLNLRTYVERRGATEILLLSVRVSLGGIVGALFGVPVRPARLRVREGSVAAPGLGVSFEYERLAPVGAVPDVGGAPIGSQASALALTAGIRRIDAAHDPFAWEAAELVAPPRVDPVLALGFDLAWPDSVLYAARTAFRVELPPKSV